MNVGLSSLKVEQSRAKESLSGKSQEKPYLGSLPLDRPKLDHYIIGGKGQCQADLKGDA